MSRQKLFPLLAFFLLLVATITLYGMAPLMPRAQGLFPAVAGADGAYYVLRLKTALEGDPTMSCPFSSQLKSFSTFIPNFMENTWASFLKPLISNDLSLGMTLTYLILPAFIFVLLVGFLYLIFANVWLALFLGFWGVTESSIYFWKPFAFNTLDLVEPLPYSRYANPMLFQIPYLLAFGSLFYLTQLHEKRKEVHPHPWLTLAVISLGGLLFYTQVYYSVYFTLSVTIFAAICAVRKNWGQFRLALFVLVGVGFLGAPELIKSINLLVAPGILDILHRIGCLIRDRTPYFLLHKGFLLTFIVYQIVCWKHWNTKWKVLTASMLAGYFCLNQATITGLASHDHHYFRPMMITYIFVVAHLFTHLFHVLPHPFRRKNVAIALGLFFCAFVGIKGAHFSLQHINHKFKSGVRELRDDQMKDTLAKMRDIPAEAKGPVLANTDYTYLLEVLGNTEVYIDEYFYHCITSDDLLFRRWAILGKVFGWPATQVNAFLRNFVDHSNLSYWLYGLPAQYDGPKNRYTTEEKDRRVDKWVAAYREARAADLINYELLQGSAPKYVLQSPGYNPDSGLLQKHFKMTFMFEVPHEKTKLWRLDPKNPT